MSDGAYLPEFVREALEVDEGSRVPPVDGAIAGVDGALETGAIGAVRLAGIERCFGALLEAAWPDDGAPAVGAPRLAGAGGRLKDFEPSVALFGRLQATIDEPPYRYAPFFALTAQLFDLPEPAVIEELARLAEPKVWRFAGLPGIHHAAIRGGARVESAETLFVRFSPGVRFPKHRHTGLEQVLVLEGSYRDSTGVVHRAGELREWAEGTEHGFVVDPNETCIFASVVFGRRFSAWPLRALASVLGR
jgi:anti-sigma factor ChrR (cupin superfamily)